MLPLSGLFRRQMTVVIEPGEARKLADSACGSILTGVSILPLLIRPARLSAAAMLESTGELG
jgi:hypothetical protein